MEFRKFKNKYASLSDKLFLSNEFQTFKQLNESECLHFLRSEKPPPGTWYFIE